MVSASGADAKAPNEVPKLKMATNIAISEGARSNCPFESLYPVEKCSLNAVIARMPLIVLSRKRLKSVQPCSENPPFAFPNPHE